jgi:hypothetical protein
MGSQHGATTERIGITQLRKYASDAGKYASGAGLVVLAQPGAAAALAAVRPPFAVGEKPGKRINVKSAIAGVFRKSCHVRNHCGKGHQPASVRTLARRRIQRVALLRAARRGTKGKLVRAAYRGSSHRAKEVSQDVRRRARGAAARPAVALVAA